jgi:hypothetical protein
MEYRISAQRSGGLGIEVLELKNKCLLSKWLFKLINEEGIWQELLQNKYLSQKTLSQVQAKPMDSPFWKGLMRAKEDFFARGSFKIGDGSEVRFWEDVWLGTTSLAARYPMLYHIVQYKDVTVANVLANTPVNIRFRRVLSGNKWSAWLRLCQEIMVVQLSDEQDRFLWNLTSSRSFSVKSMYEDFMNGHTPFLRQYLWKMKIPLKIKIFMWFLNNKVILTKDNLVKRKWKGCTNCCFCGAQETVEHLFILCPFAKVLWQMVHFAYNLPPPTNISNMFGNWLNGVEKHAKERIRIGISALCWSIWRCRNDIVFNKSTNFNFMQVIHMMVHWAQQWAILSSQAQRDAMAIGCKQLLTIAQDTLYRAGWRHISRLKAA